MTKSKKYIDDNIKKNKNKKRETQMGSCHLCGIFLTEMGTLSSIGKVFN